jgi:hypothetical protein
MAREARRDGARARRTLSWRAVVAVLALGVAGALLGLCGRPSKVRGNAALADTPGDDGSSITGVGPLSTAHPDPRRAPLSNAAPPPSDSASRAALLNLPPGRSPYPPGSQPLTEGTDPATQPKGEAPISPGDGITCLYGPRVAVVHPPDPLVIDLEVKNRLGARMPITNAVVRFRPDRSDPKAPWFESPLVDDGTDKDFVAGDFQYTATYFPTDEQKAAIFKGGSHVFVEVRFEAPKGLGPRVFPAVMEYSRLPNATLTGTYADAVVDGSLVITADVNATQAGQYRLIGSLYVAGTESAIAVASKQVQLDTGDGTIPLLYFGKILYDRGLNGPYELRYVMLFEETVGQESIPGVTVDHAYTTRRYSARDFSAASYVEPPPTFENVDRFSLSEQGKPAPLLGDDLTGQAPTALPTATTRAAPAPTSSAK